MGGVLAFLLIAIAGVAAMYGAYRWFYGVDPDSRTSGQGTPSEADETPNPAASTHSPASPYAPPPALPSVPEPGAPLPADESPAPTEVLPEEPPPAGGEVRLALVIDDLGRSLEDVRSFEELGVPVTYAVLPFESRTPDVVEALQSRGAEILLHLPMEGRGGANPGPGALLAGMSPDELVAATRAALAAVPPARGVNNHMGSVLTADGPSMALILEVVAADELFFLDSRTSPESVGYRMAVERGLPAAERDVFLDPDPADEAVRFQFRRMLEVGRRQGAAIAIGHPLPGTLRVLREEVPKAVAQGYRFVPVSYLLDRTGLPE